MLRIGRTKAYAMAREWRETGGRSGLPVIDFGNVLRVPRHALEELIGAPIEEIAALGTEPSSEPVVDPPGEPLPEPTPAPAPPSAPAHDPTCEPRADGPHTRPRRQRRASVKPTNQLDLFELPPSA